MFKFTVNAGLAEKYFGFTEEWSAATKAVISTIFKKNFTVALSQLPPATDPSHISSLTVQPFFYVPSKQFHMSWGNRPFWVSDEGFKRGIVPWCLTWRVDEFTEKSNNGYSKVHKFNN